MYYEKVKKLLESIHRSYCIAVIDTIGVDYDLKNNANASIFRATPDTFKTIVETIASSKKYDILIIDRIFGTLTVETYMQMQEISQFLSGIAKDYEITIVT